MVPFRRFENLNSAIMALRHQGMFVVALETVKNGMSPEDFCWKFPCALILGNERFGLSAEILQMCDAVVTIPSYGRKNSLNVVTAFGVAAYLARLAWNRDLNTKQLTR
jgi:tRNA G18 (ribose-2'-O)-methylase SpoU